MAVLEEVLYWLDRLYQVLLAEEEEEEELCLLFLLQEPKHQYHLLSLCQCLSADCNT